MYPSGPPKLNLFSSEVWFSLSFQWFRGPANNVTCFKVDKHVLTPHIYFTLGAERWELDAVRRICLLPDAVFACLTPPFIFLPYSDLFLKKFLAMLWLLPYLLLFILYYIYDFWLSRSLFYYFISWLPGRMKSKNFLSMQRTSVTNLGQSTVFT